MITVTTGRNPTQSTRRLCKELSRVIPDSRRLVRGKRSLNQIIDEMKASGSDRLMLIQRRSGNPHRIELNILKNKTLRSFPPSIILKGVKLPPAKNRGLKIKVECITTDSDDILPLGASLSKFLKIPLVKLNEPKFEYSLHLSRDLLGRVIITILNLRTSEERGLTIYVERLEW
ncbi:Brix domain-containing protein [Candidatus Bathyarchaeota archaeon]|nr:Brix domain-containing protein [Candidatus Bathyarchaeota archaeon]